MFSWQRFWPFAAVLATAVLVPLLGQSQESATPPSEATEAPKPEGSPSFPAPAAPDAGAPLVRPPGSVAVPEVL
jgi:hypothetical protein